MLLAKEDGVTRKGRLCLFQAEGAKDRKSVRKENSQRQKNKQRVVEPTAQGFGAWGFKAESVRSRSERA